MLGILALVILVSVAIVMFATLRTTVQPQTLNHFQQLNAATISGVPMPGITLGQALDTMKNLARQVLPQGYSVDYAGQARQFEMRAVVAGRQLDGFSPALNAIPQWPVDPAISLPVAPCVMPRTRQPWLNRRIGLLE